MNPTTNIANFFALAVIAGLAAGLVVQRELRIKAETEQATLEQQVETLRSIAAENSQLSNVIAHMSASKSLPEDEMHELLQLRAEVSKLRRQTADLGSVLKENSEVNAAAERRTHDRSAEAAKAPPTADYWPRDSWAFAGYATPDAALQSSLWAANSGDLKTVLDAVTGEIRENLDAALATKSETEVLATVMDQVTGTQSIRVLDRTTQPDGTVLITAAFESRYDTQKRKLILKKVGNDWKVASGQ